MAQEEPQAKQKICHNWKEAAWKPKKTRLAVPIL